MSTSKPCHGCKRPVRRSVDSLCDECEAALRAGRTMLESKTRDADAGVLVRIPCDWPTILYANGRVVEQVLFRLAKACLAPAKEDPYGKLVRSCPPKERWFATDQDAECRRGPSRLVDALNELDAAIRKAISSAHEDGVKEGKNLLIQVAKGDITMAELSAETLEASRGRHR